MSAAKSVRFGPAGWSYPDWNQPIYKGNERRPLELIATVFDTVEVNSTFYRMPSSAIAKGWLRKVAQNPTFLFCVKLWNGFTHAREYGQPDVAAFLSGIEPLADADRLGALLMQFPWSFKYSREAFERVARLVRALSGHAIALEVRHASWDRPEIRDEMRSLGVNLCNIDQPLFSNSLAPSAHVTGNVGYVRLHGRNRANWFREDADRDARYDYRYSATELDPWVERIRGVAGSSERVFVVTNNHFGGSAIVNALDLQHLYSGETVSDVPAQWLRSFPHLRAFCRSRPPAQGELFGAVGG